MIYRIIKGQPLNAPILATLLLILTSSLAAGASPQIHGTLSLDTSNALEIEVLRDGYGFAKMPARRVNELPGFKFDYVQSGDRLIPLQRGSIPSQHPHWEYILEPGRVLQGSRGSMDSQVSLPVTLQEREANCMHNGVLEFRFNQNGIASQAQFRLTGETCLYFKFNLQGELSISYTPNPDLNAEAAITRDTQQRQARLPVAPLSQLEIRYPGIDIAGFRGGDRVDEANITVSGFILDGQHYSSDCATRSGPYPFCNEMSLPSYSLAKTLVAGLGLMRMEKLYPGSLKLKISDYVPECNNSGNWDDVTFEHALNMQTGNLGSTDYLADENSKRTDDEFFFASSHKDKINFSCTAWPRRAPPGTRWVYHTTDTYVLATAMTARLQEYQGRDADIYDDLVLPLWEPLDLSPALSVTRRTTGQPAQPFVGFGLTLQRDDIARLGVALNERYFDDNVDKDLMDRAMHPVRAKKVDYQIAGSYRYSQKFWAYDATNLLGCSEPLVIPFMSGYGGINVVMMPNDTVYYIFSDGDQFHLADAIVQSHRIRAMCPESSATFNKK